MLLHAAAPDGETPPLGEPGQGAWLSAELIYPLDDKPTPQCHASTLAETPAGLVAAWFGGTEEKHPDVGVWVARLRDGAWTDPVEVANGVQKPELRYPCWNPVLFQAPGGPLLLFYKVGPNPREWWGMLTASPDAGATWSEPRKLGEGPLGHLIGPVKNKPIQLEDGSLLCPSSTESHELGWRVHFELTPDLGDSWKVIGPIHDASRFDAIQPSILTYPNNRMQILCRTQQGVISQSWSEDGGLSWGEMTATELPNPSSGTDAVTLDDGRQLLVYNHTLPRSAAPEGAIAGRDMLNVAVSRDGRSWRPVLTLERERGAPGGFCYPAVIQTADGLVHITYTYKRISIKHAVVQPDKL
jgi:predicted neuraminidase